MTPHDAIPDRRSWWLEPCKWIQIWSGKSNWPWQLCAKAYCRCDENVVEKSVVFFQCHFAGFVFSISFFGIYFVIHPRLCFLMSWEPSQLQHGFIKQMQLVMIFFNLCRWFSGFVWQVWHMSCRLLLWNHGTRTERWMKMSFNSNRLNSLIPHLFYKTLLQRLRSIIYMDHL